MYEYFVRALSYIWGTVHNILTASHCTFLERKKCEEVSKKG